MIRKKSVFIIILAALSMFPAREHTGSVLMPELPPEYLDNAEIRKDISGIRQYTVADVTYTRWQKPHIMDAVLSMNTPAGLMERDDTGHYKIKRAMYETVSGQGETGSACAGFSSPQHIIELESSPYLFLGRPGDLGSFNIEFRVLSPSLVDGDVIFSRTGYFSGTKRGMEIIFRDRKITAVFHNLFIHPDGTRETVVLSEGTRLIPGKWHHFCLSFDRLTGKLAKYLDGTEDQAVFATEDGTSFSTVLIPAFGRQEKDGTFSPVEEPSARIGGFRGLLDEFRISTVTRDELKEQAPMADRRYMELKTEDRIPFNREGIITSPVMELPDTGYSVTDFTWEEKLPENTFIWTEFRISDRLFHEKDRDIKWYRIAKDQKNIYLHKTPEGLYMRGKYFQWRAHLVVSPDGKNAPSMWNIRMAYQSDTAPSAPALLQVAETGDGFIRIKWKKNTDADLMGYRIYYGTVPGRYDGIIRTAGGKIIGNSLADKDGFIEVTIDNDVIEENRKNDRNRLLTWPLLQNTVLYFIAVTAWDNYREGTPFSHESPCSEPVTARPYAGSEIR